jgi:GDP-4-dehydro-6-deoxy-D-mannose reductase
MRILITGITGFVGGHLAELLLSERRNSLTGISRTTSWPADLKHLESAVPLHALDLNDVDQLASVLVTTQPDWIFHLAGYANTGKSFLEPDLCWKDNLSATRSLYDAVASQKLKPRILFVSTGLIYGEAQNSEPLSETAELKPASPYATSKAAADLLSYQCTRSMDLDIVRVRLFNQIGPRQSADYAIANFARQLGQIEAGQQKPVLTTGDLSAGRDLTDVRDVVKAFRLLIEHGRTGEAYNAGSGKNSSIRDVLKQLVALSHSRVEIQERPDPNRRQDTAVTLANCSKLHSLTGWQPQYTLDQSLTDILDYWRKQALGT